MTSTIDLQPETATPAPDLRALFDAQRAAFLRDPYPDRARRVAALETIERLMETRQDDIARAIAVDFGARSFHETVFGETSVVLAAARFAKRNLRRWMRPRRPPTALHFRPGYGRILRQPVGVAGVVSPWNYPLQLALAPAVAALAAGCRVLLKPSELTPRTSALIAEMVAENFAPDQFAVIQGDAEVAKAFVRLPFDHLLFTGSTAVGREVAKAAAANLTPTTLELGGKSPAIFDPSADFDEAVPRLIWGKLFNAGQTCVAPDYVLAPRGRIEELAEACVAAARRFYPALADNPDYTGIATPRHYERLKALVADARAKGAQVIDAGPDGETSPPGNRKMPLTVLLNPTDDMAAMREEIFGPILPIVAYDSPEDAIAYVNARPRPLALYWFGRDAARRDDVLNRTHAGGVTVNDALWHLVQEHMPFGGVGDSGWGAYHGEAGFLTFTKEKPVFHQSRFNGGFLLRPPYRRAAEIMAKLIRKAV